MRIFPLFVRRESDALRSFISEMRPDVRGLFMLFCVESFHCAPHTRGLGLFQRTHKESPHYTKIKTFLSRLALVRRQSLEMHFSNFCVSGKVLICR